MHFTVIARVLGILLMLFSLTMLPPMLVSMWYNDDAIQAFATALLLIFGLGFFCWLPVRKVRQDLRTRDGFLITVLFWLVLSLTGSFPFLLAVNPSLTFTDAFFASLSCWTHTGATALTGNQHLPQSD
mgnify:FL=1